MSLLALAPHVRLFISTATATPTTTTAAAPGTASRRPRLAVVRLREVGPRVRPLRLSYAVAHAYFVVVAAPGAEARDRARPDRRAQRSGDEKLQGAQSELLAAKRELERVTGELKFAHQEQRTLGRLQADLSTAQRELSAEHDRAERLSAKLVAEANAALLDENAAAEGSAHPVFGELLHDFGHKRLYRASPLTLWTGTVLWDSQRAFRQERAELIAKSKTRSTVGGWPGVISAVLAGPPEGEHANGNHNGVAPHTNGVHNDGMAPPHGAFPSARGGQPSLQYATVVPDVGHRPPPHAAKPSS